MRIAKRILLSGFVLLFVFTLVKGQNTNKKLALETSFKKNKVTLENALSTIEKKYDVSLLYSNKLVENKMVVQKKFSGSFKDELTNILSPFHLSFNQLNNKSYTIIPISIVKNSFKKIVLQDSLKGKVVDAKTREALPGVNILVQGTSVGTATNLDGEYSLELPSGADTLIFSYIGYNTQKVPISGRSQINIRLTHATLGGEEVVVVGYGTEKRKNVTGSVSSIDYESQLKNQPITDPSQALSGKVSGVWVSQNSGEPGSDGAMLRVRGFGTLNNSDPLVLIDGVEGQLAELNPNDIKSISVLKDAASAAIYGSRAANGVILVTTKKGAYNSKPELSYNGYFGFQKLGQRYQIIDNSVTFMNMWNQAVVNSGGDPLFPQETINAFENGSDPYKYPNTNFYDDVFQTAPITEHNISVRGGSDNQQYYLSVNYLDQQGIIKQTSSKRFGVNFNLNSKVNDWIELGGQLRVTRKKSNRPYDDINRVMYIFRNGAYPFIAPYTRDGQFGATQAVYMSGPKKGQPIVDSRNPLPDLYNGLSGYTNNFINGSLNANLNITKNVEFKSKYSGQFNNNMHDRYNELNYVYTTGGLKSTTLDYPTTITNSRSDVNEYYWVFYNTLNYDQSFSDVHDVSLIAGMQIEDRHTRNLSGSKSEPPKDGLHQIDAATSNQIANGDATQWRMLSYFGRLKYNYNDRYIAEANLRADASSRFKEGNRWGLFPSFSLGWRIDQESFMEDIDFISNLKLRGSWGRLGNQNINSIAGNFPYLTTITQSNSTSYNLGGKLVPGAAKTEIVDKSITWETTETTDIGLDMGLFSNNVNLGFDYFYKKTKDILVRLPIPQILGGVSAPVQNVGQMKNDGYELNASYNRNINNDLSFQVGANFSYVNNEVVKFRNGNSPDQLYLIREGVSYQALYGYHSLGVFKTDEEAKQYMANNSYIPSAGDLKYEDVNKDGKLNYKDQMVLGNTIPKYTYGINVSVGYKNFNLNVVTQGIAKVYANTQNAWTQPLGISGATITKRWKNAWSKDNKSSTLPKIKINDTWNRKNSSFWITNLSYFKIRSAQLSYNIPNNISNSFGVRNLDFYLNVQNPYTWVTDNYEGFNPERSTFNSGSNQYPTPIITTLGVNIQF